MEFVKSCAQQCSSGWSFMYGMITYAAIQSKCLRYAIDKTKFFLPLQAHYTLVGLYTFSSFLYMFASFQFNKFFTVLDKYIQSLCEYCVQQTAQQIAQPLNLTSSIPQKTTMKRPIPRQELTSEFISGPRYQHTQDSELMTKTESVVMQEKVD